MKTVSTTIGYQLRILRTEHLWMPAGLWALFALMALLMRRDRLFLDVIGAYLGAILPLTSAMLAAPVVVEDVALELHLAAPRRPWRMLVERLALIFAIVAVAAGAFQLWAAVLGADASRFGGPIERQALWAAPTLAMLGFSSVLALAGANATAGSAMAGLAWILQLLARGWFADSWWARYVFLFMGVTRPGSPYLAANRLALVALGLGLTAVAGVLLRKEERYL